MTALVTASICPLLSRPAADGSLTDEALLGFAVECLETEGDFVRVRTHYRYEGWAPRSCLTTWGVEDWLARPKRVALRKNLCDALARPHFDSLTLARLPRGAVVAVEGGPESGWQGVLLPDGQKAYTRSSNLSEYYENPPVLPEEDLRRRLTDTARGYLGTAYRWGGKTPLGIDCSGLVSMAYLLNGIRIYRDSKPLEGFPIRPIPREKVKPGDLLYFPGHVAMALEEGDIIHSTGFAGADGVTIQSLRPGAPGYREDLDRSLLTAGTYF